MTGLFGNTITTALGASGKPLQNSCLFDIDGRYFQLVDISAIVMFSVRNRGLEHFFDDDCTFFGAEGQNIERLLNLLAAYQISYEAALLG